MLFTFSTSPGSDRASKNVFVPVIPSHQKNPDNVIPGLMSCSLRVYSTQSGILSICRTISYCSSTVGFVFLPADNFKYCEDNRHPRPLICRSALKIISTLKQDIITYLPQIFHGVVKLNIFLRNSHQSALQLQYLVKASFVVL